MLEKNKYCVYIHYNCINKEVFYVGMGDLKRPYEVLNSQRNKYWINYINLIERQFNINICFENLSWEEAGEIEKQLIKFYGRRNTNTGSLVNLTDGGDSTHGWIPSNETKRKISEAVKGFKHTEEAKLKISLKHKGTKQSIDHVKKRVESRKNNPDKRDLTGMGKGRKLTIEQSLKQSIRQQGRKIPEKGKYNIKQAKINNPYSKGQIQAIKDNIIIGTYFNSIEAANILNLNAAHINKSIRENLKYNKITFKRILK